MWPVRSSLPPSLPLSLSLSCFFRFPSTVPLRVIAHRTCGTACPRDGTRLQPVRKTRQGAYGGIFRLLVGEHHHPDPERCRWWHVCVCVGFCVHVCCAFLQETPPTLDTHSCAPIPTDNDIGISGFDALMNMLDRNSSITSLDLSGPLLSPF